MIALPVQLHGQTTILRQHPRRRGVAMIVGVTSMVVMIGFCSFAVDFGRCQMVKTELRRGADAAARAAVANLASGTTATQNAAYNMAILNKADGSTITISKTNDVQFLNWVSKSNFTVVASAAQANAVRVYCRRTVTTGNPVNLMFASLLGFHSVDITTYATALFHTQTTTQYVSAFSNPWLAGEPNGTQASQPDPAWRGQNVNPDHPWEYDIAGPVGGHNGAGEPYESPIQVAITVIPGATVTITNVSGSAGYEASKGADGTARGNYTGSGKPVPNADDDASNNVSEHGIADATMPHTALNAVFLNNNLPDNQTVPPPLDFSTQASRDYTNISPQRQQVFYVGDGQTSDGDQQSITVPAGTTRMYLGVMDGHEWSNNIGGYNATVTQTDIEMVQ